MSTLGSRRERKGQPATRHRQHVVCVLLIAHGTLSQGCTGRWAVGRGAHALPKDHGPGRGAAGAEESERGKAAYPRIRTEGEAPSLRKDWTRGSRRTRKAVHGACSVEPMKREGTLRVTRGDEIEGAEPYEVKASSTVLNGGREETCLASAGNAPASIMASATPFCFCTTQKHLTLKRSRSSRA